MRARVPAVTFYHLDGRASIAKICAFLRAKSLCSTRNENKNGWEQVNSAKMRVLHIQRTAAAAAEKATTTTTTRPIIALQIQANSHRHKRSKSVLHINIYLCLLLMPPLPPLRSVWTWRSFTLANLSRNTWNEFSVGQQVNQSQFGVTFFLCGHRTLCAFGWNAWKSSIWLWCWTHTGMASEPKREREGASVYVTVQ